MPRDLPRHLPKLIRHWQKTLSGLSWTSWVLVSIILASAILRVSALESVPPGFWQDEADEASGVVCYSQMGQTYFGERIPHYQGGHNPAYVLLGAFWTKVFGHSIGALRGLTAWSTVVAILLLGWMVYRKLGLKAGLWVTAAASISPWGWFLSRLAWGLSMPPFYTVAGLAMFVLWPTTWGYAIAAIFWGLCLYTYRAMLFSVPSFIGGLMVANWGLIRPVGRKWWVFAGCFSLFLLPYAYFFTQHDYISHGLYVGLFSIDPSNPTAGKPWFYKVPQSIENYFSHFTPSFLLLRGDTNLRHTFGGVLSWLDAGVLLLAIIFFRRLRTVIGADPATQRLIKIAFLGWAAGILPAAATWYAPHAVRTIFAWPFVALATGLLAAKFADLSRGFERLLTVVVAASFVFQMYQYFVVYPGVSAPWFSPELKAAALRLRSSQDPEWRKLLEPVGQDARDPEIVDYFRRVGRYFEIQYFGEKCRPAALSN